MKHKNPSLDTSQAVNPYTIVFICLLFVIFFICKIKNYSSHLKARIVGNPLITDVNPVTIGELDIARKRTISLCVFK